MLFRSIAGRIPASIITVILLVSVTILTSCTGDNDDEPMESVNNDWSASWAISSGKESATDLMIDTGTGNTLHVISGDYYNDERCELRYAYFNGQVWTDEKVPFESPFYGEEADIAVDSMNIPHIAFIDEANAAIRYAVKYNSDWSFDLVANPPGYSLNTGIDIDSLDNPHLIYDTCSSGIDYKYTKKIDNRERGVWYAYRQNNTWKIEKIAGDGAIARTIAIDISDNPHTAYAVESEDGAIFYAYRDNGEWMTEQVDSGWMQNSDVFIDTDSQNRPHMVYKTGNGEIRYAVKAGSTWTFETLRQNSGEQSGVRIQIDNEDTIHVYYSEEDIQQDDIICFHTYKTIDGSWQAEKIGIGGEGDLAVTTDGTIFACSGCCANDDDAEWVRCYIRKAD